MVVYVFNPFVLQFNTRFQFGRKIQDHLADGLGNKPSHMSTPPQQRATSPCPFGGGAARPVAKVDLKPNMAVPSALLFGSEVACAMGNPAIMVASADSKRNSGCPPISVVAPSPFGTKKAPAERKAPATSTAVSAAPSSSGSSYPPMSGAAKKTPAAAEAEDSATPSRTAAAVAPASAGPTTAAAATVEATAGFAGEGAHSSAAVATSAATPAASTEGSFGMGGSGPALRAAAVTPATGAVVGTLDYRAQVVEIYTNHIESKLGEVDTILKAYA